ncbi:MAG: transcriptional regulator PpsR, partial [Gammaproteobacteria bacterium]|nr:transcriptional regulator PpsR [Gammaproteobacteria bacterium]
LYAAVKLKDDGTVMAIGRSMRPMAALQQQIVQAQNSMERELAKLRQAEVRHRLLFQMATEAVLIVDAATHRILEANPAAARLLGQGAKELIGHTFPEDFDAAGNEAVHSMLGAVRVIGRPETLEAVTRDGRRRFKVAAALFREERASFFLIRLSALDGQREALESPQGESQVMKIVANSPEAFLVTDLEGRIRFANRAFLDLAQLATLEQARNEPLDRWLGRSGVDFGLLSAQLREHGTLRLYATQLRGEFGSMSDVEICAVAVPDADPPCFGFTIRSVGPRVALEKTGARDRPRSVAQLTELVGRVPLKDLVRESTDMIEKLCIEAALEITGDNRASAAEILGLSRQSLYAKLRRYGLGELGSADEPLIG